MKFKTLVEPKKIMYQFGSHEDKCLFSDVLGVRIHEILAQKFRLDATADLGYLGCGAVAKIDAIESEVWIDFRFKKATVGKTSQYTGKVDYFPRGELNALQNYLFVGDISQNISVSVRNVPTYNRKGEVEKVDKNAAVLRIHAIPALCLALIIDRSILEESFYCRFGFTEKGNVDMNEYVDEDLVDKYLPVDYTVQINAGASVPEFDPDQTEHAVKIQSETLIVHPEAAIIRKAMANKYKEAAAEDTKSDDAKPNQKQKDKQKKKSRYNGRGGA